MLPKPGGLGSARSDRRRGDGRARTLKKLRSQACHAGLLGLLFASSLRGAGQQQVGSTGFKRSEKKPVDDVPEGLHNLASLLLEQQRKTAAPGSDGAVC